MNAPVALFVYNRVDHARRTISSLQGANGAEETDLYIFSDGPKSPDAKAAIEAVRTEIDSVEGFKSVKIVKAQKNKGLAKSIIGGVSLVLEQHDRVIVVEDDLVVSEDFLDFMNACLQTYADRDDIFSVSGYSYPVDFVSECSVVLTSRPSSWGWATWKQCWDKVDWEVSDFDAFMSSRGQRQEFNTAGEDLSLMLELQQKNLIDSWAIRWSYAHFKHDAYTVQPLQSRVSNEGFDGSGTHTAASGKYDVSLAHSGMLDLPADIRYNPENDRLIKDLVHAPVKHAITVALAKVPPLYRLAKKMVMKLR